MFCVVCVDSTVVIWCALAGAGDATYEHRRRLRNIVGTFPGLVYGDGISICRYARVVAVALFSSFSELFDLTNKWR